MSINEFIESVNSSQPGIEQRLLVHKDSLREDVLSYHESQQLKATNKFQVSGNPVEELIYHTNIHAVDIGYLYFDNELRDINKEFRSFARFNDYYIFCISIEDDRVVCFPGDSLEFEHVTASFEQFLCFLCEYQKIHNPDL